MRALCAVLMLCVLASVSMADELRELVRAGIELQNRILIGRGGEPELRVLRQRIEEAVLAMTVDDLRNRESSVACSLLAGLMGRTSDLASKSPEPSPLLTGIFAYLEQRDEDARAALDRVDVDLVDALLAPYLAFAKAELAEGQTPDLFLSAAMLSPKSAVEEASLRRGIQLLLVQGSTLDLSRLVRRYVSRYRQGPFAQKFLQDLESALIRRYASEKAVDVDTIRAIARAAGDDAWMRNALDISRMRLQSGALGDAGIVAREALDLAAPGSGEHARASVYLAASHPSGPRINARSVRPKLAGWDLALATFLDDEPASRMNSVPPSGDWKSDPEVLAKYMHLEQQLTRASELEFRNSR